MVKVLVYIGYFVVSMALFLCFAYVSSASVRPMTSENQYATFFYATILGIPISLAMATVFSLLHFYVFFKPRVRGKDIIRNQPSGHEKSEASNSGSPPPGGWDE